LKKKKNTNGYGIKIKWDLGARISELHIIPFELQQSK